MSEPATPTVAPDTDTRSRLLPPYHVIVENDDHHSQMFVVLVLRKVFGYDEPRAIDLMMTAHETGQAVVWTGPKEVAELKLDQLRTFHEEREDADLGPLGCRIEPAA